MNEENVANNNYANIDDYTFLKKLSELDEAKFFDITGSEELYEFLKNCNDEVFYYFWSFKRHYNNHIFEQNDLMNRLAAYNIKYNSPISYRKRIGNLSKNNDENIIDRINKLRLKVYDDFMNQDNCYFLDCEKEVICDTLFEKPYDYIWKILSIVIKYIDDFNEKDTKLNNEQITLIKKLYAVLSYCGIDDKLLLNSYNELKDKNIDYMDFLNNCYNIAKKDAISLLSCSLIKENDIKSLTNDKISEINVYNLEGEPFMLLVHKTSHSKAGDWPKNEDDILSFSLISDKAVDKVWNCGDVLLGFVNITPEKIINTCAKDSDTKMMINNNFKSDFITPSSLIANTKHHNDITVKGNIFPSYVCCYNDVRDIDVAVAMKLGIDILKINTKKYKEKLEGEHMMLSRSI
jgi:hypothetical protein